MLADTAKKYDIVFYRTDGSTTLSQEETQSLHSMLVNADNCHQLIVDTNNGNVAVGFITNSVKLYWDDIEYLNKRDTYDFIRGLLDKSFEHVKEEDTSFFFEGHDIYFNDSPFSLHNKLSGGIINP